MNLRKRVLFAFGIGRVSAPADESGAVQMLQVSHHTGEVHDDVPSAQIFGLASVPLAGCDHVIIYGEGDRSKGIAIASNDQRLRPKGMAGGEVQLYDASGQSVYLQGGTQVTVTGKTSIVLAVGGVSLTIDAAGFHFVGGPVMADQDITAGFGGDDAVKSLNHTHEYTPGDGTPTQTSGPVAGT